MHPLWDLISFPQLPGRWAWVRVSILQMETLTPGQVSRSPEGDGASGLVSARSWTAVWGPHGCGCLGNAQSAWGAVTDWVGSCAEAGEVQELQLPSMQTRLRSEQTHHGETPSFPSMCPQPALCDACTTCSCPHSACGSQARPVHKCHARALGEFPRVHLEAVTAHAKVC